MKKLISISFFIIITISLKSFCQKIEILEIKENTQTENFQIDTNIKSNKQFAIIETVKEDINQNNNSKIKETNHKELPKKQVTNKNIEIVKVKEDRKGLEDER